MKALVRSQSEIPVLSETLFQQWIEYLDVSPKTLATYSNGIRQFVHWLEENKISAPTRSDIIRYRDELKARVKPATVQLYLISVRLFFQWTAQEHIYPNVAEHIKGPKIGPEHRRDYLTASQVNLILDEIDTSTVLGKRDFAMIALMATTGLRAISVSLADICDMRPLGGNLALYYQGKGHEEKSKYVWISDEVERAIQNYLAARGTKSSDEPIFCSMSHHNFRGRMVTRSIEYIVKNRMKNVGLNRSTLTAHSLRHTAATLNILNGGTVEETQQMLDHCNIATTYIYVHVLERQNNKSELRVSDAIFHRTDH